MPARTFAVEKCPRCGCQLVQRSIEQNAALHAALHDIATQKQWMGQWLDVETWKRLLTCAWERTQGRQARLFPALDGHGMDVVYSRTSRMSKQDLSDLLDYVHAWGADQGVKFAAPEGLAA
jgi:hypothetical protein